MSHVVIVKHAARSWVSALCVACQSTLRNLWRWSRNHPQVNQVHNTYPSSDSASLLARHASKMRVHLSVPPSVCSTIASSFFLFVSDGILSPFRFFPERLATYGIVPWGTTPFRHQLVTHAGDRDPLIS